MDEPHLQSVEDQRFMAQALQLARRGLYSTPPNPAVGCVIVRNGQCVGAGYHERAGLAHAEVNALNEAGHEASGATAYVTLEPCNHHGRTPPCAQKLIEAGISRVVFAAGDPNPQVSGNGARSLQEAGIETQVGVLEHDARALNRGFYKRAEHGRPFVVVKVAMSLDAKIGLKSGESKWITGQAARADGQRLRARSSAIVTGRATIVADDPRLDVREPRFDTAGRQPLRVILDSKLALDTGYRVFDPPGEVLVASGCREQKKIAALARIGASVECLPLCDGRVDLPALLERLAARDCNEVLVEAGPTVVSAFLTQALCDELVIYVAPKIIGSNGTDGLPLALIDRLGDALEVEVLSVTAIGDDLRIVSRPRHT